MRAALLLLLAAASLPGAAHAQISASVAAVSDYRFRGISQSDRKPALQGSVAYDHPSGLFAGLFVSTVDFDDDTFQADAQTYLQAGFARRLTVDLSWEIGIARYDYLRASSNWNYGEAFAGVTWRDLNARVHYAPDYINRGARSTYLEVNGTRALNERTALFGHVGYWSIEDGSRRAAARSQIDVRVGVAFDLGVVSLEISGVATNVSSDECPGAPNWCQPGVVVAILKSF